MTPVLRDYQVDGVTAIRAEYQRGNRRTLYVAPTGSGKTTIFAYIATQAQARAQRVWILAHRVELVDQISASLANFGTPHAFIAAGYPVSHRAPVQVCSVFTLAKRLHKVEPPDLIIVDEAHHATADTTWGKVLASFPRARVLGVTATPIRLDGTGLRDCFDVMVIGPTVADLTARGALVPLKAFAPALVSTEGLHTRAGEFIASELAERADNTTVTGDAVAHYNRLAAGKAAVAFCVSVQHAKHVADSFSAAGIPAQSVDGTMDRALRRTIVQAFTSGALRVLTSCDLVSEGFDVPRIECGISLRPTQSEGLWLQQVGRILRPFPGKSHAILLDHAGNIQRHGLPEDPRDWTLDGKVAGAKRAANELPDLHVRICVKCFAAVKSIYQTCPNCGHVFPVIARTVDVEAGELAEVTAETRRAMTPEQRERAREQGQAKDFDALVEVGRRRGMKNPEGWAKHVMAGRQAKIDREAARRAVEVAMSYDVHASAQGV